MPSVLIIDDEPNIRRMVGALLAAEGYEVRDAHDGAGGLSRALEAEPDALLLDLMMPGELDGMATLARVRESLPDVPVIMMSGRAGLSDAVKATKLGAFNFLEKPLSPESVLLALSSALELRQARREARTLRADLGLSGEMIGDSPAMTQVRALIARVAPSDSRVLITGESGTGKELVAAAIHAGSARRDRPFVRVNCAAIPRDLVESEMFGHERGAFTGATDRRIGRFELAHRGTLFLDEVGDLGAEAQAKLLRAIEAKEIERVGGGKPIRVDVRIVVGDEQGSRARCERRRVSRGPAVSAQRDPDSAAAAARPAGRHSAARAALRRAAPAAHGTSGAGVERRGRLRALASPLARQRARAGEHRRASGDPARGPSRDGGDVARGAAARARAANADAADVASPPRSRRAGIVAQRHARRLRANADLARAVDGERQRGRGGASAADRPAQPVPEDAAAGHRRRRRVARAETSCIPAVFDWSFHV